MNVMSTISFLPTRTDRSCMSSKLIQRLLVPPHISGIRRNRFLARSSLQSYMYQASRIIDSQIQNSNIPGPILRKDLRNVNHFRFQGYSSWELPVFHCNALTYIALPSTMPGYLFQLCFQILQVQMHSLAHVMVHFRNLPTLLPRPYLSDFHTSSIVCLHLFPLLLLRPPRHL
jgi:hypothetical protein